MTISPIWRNAEGRAARRASISPGPGYPGRSLLANATLVEVAIEWLCRAAPAEIAVRSRDAVEFWEGGSDEAPTLPLDVRYQTGDYLLSVALAHVARWVAGDLDASEIRAMLSAGSDADIVDAARRKLGILEAAENAAILASMGVDMASLGGG